MPNWTENTLTVTGESVGEFLRDAGLSANTPLVENMLNTFVPMPEEQGNDWYVWRVTNWGTGWDTAAVFQPDLEPDPTLTFQTAWSPPVEWLRVVSQQYLNLTFTLAYVESGVQFAGTIIVQDGDVLSEDTYGGEWWVSDMADEGYPHPSSTLTRFVDKHNLQGYGG